MYCPSCYASPVPFSYRLIRSTRLLFLSTGEPEKYLPYFVENTLREPVGERTLALFVARSNYAQIRSELVR